MRSCLMPAKGAVPDDPRPTLPDTYVEPHDQLYFCGTVVNFTLDATTAWNKRHLTWTWSGSLPGMSPADIDAAFHQAFANWQGVCGLTFEKANGASADIMATTGPIDGPGKVLAWSELPNGSDRPINQKFDSGDSFVLAVAPPRGKIDLLAVATHEIGHALGLEHAAAGSPDLMAPIYQAGRRTPQPGDVARMQGLYGPATAPPPVLPPPPGGSTDVITILIRGAQEIRIPGYTVSKEG